MPTVRMSCGPTSTVNARNQVSATATPMSVRCSAFMPRISTAFIIFDISFVPSFSFYCSHIKRPLKTNTQIS